MDVSVAHVVIEENAPRDGLQNEPTPFTIEERVALIDRLSECGFPRIQIGSFVHPKWVPQMADTEKVYEGIRHAPGIVYSALVLNTKGLDRALSCGIPHISVFVSASETHSRKNSNCSVREAVKQAAALIEHAKGYRLQVRAGIMNAFGCRVEGEIPFERIMEIIHIYARLNADEINLADSSGLGNPRQVRETVRRVKEVTNIPLSLHCHDTNGFGLANVFAGWEEGIRRFDASCGGLGGCPFIPGATGNVASEDVVHLFDSMGIRTGVALEKVVSVVHSLEDKLGRILPGRYAHLAALQRLQCDGGGRQGGRVSW